MFILIDLCVIGVMFIVMLLFITQVMLPLVQGTPLFPFFRVKTDMKTKVAAAEHELEETTELVRLQEQLDEINRRKAQLEKKE